MSSSDVTAVWGAAVAAASVSLAALVMRSLSGESAQVSGARFGVYAFVAVLVWLFSQSLGQEGAGSGQIAAVSVLVIAIVEADARWFVIPDPLNLALCVAALVPLRAPDWTSAALGLVLCGGMFLIVRSVSRTRSGFAGLGLGDVKLAGVMGAALGVQLAVPAIGIAAAMTALWLVWSNSNAREPGRRVEGEPAAPFGVALAAALLVGLGWRVFGATSS